MTFLFDDIEAVDTAGVAELARNARSKGQKVTVTGHTDSAGVEAYNVHLSEQRAHGVKLMLVNAGLAWDDVIVVAAGSSQPKADNGTEDGRAANRRVELRIGG